jgi:hypothetical protein
VQDNLSEATLPCHKIIKKQLFNKNTMKFQCFLFLQQGIKNSRIHYLATKKEHPTFQSQSSNGSTDQSIASLVPIKKKKWFLFRIIPQGRHKNQRHDKVTNNLPISTDVSRSASGSDTVTSSSTKRHDTVSKDDKDAPVSFICTDKRIVTNESKREFFDKVSSAKLMTKHGLDREDSIISYFRAVGDACNQMGVNEVNSIDHEDDDSNNSNSDEDFYTQSDIDQAISILTMDPALTYKHSIIIDDYSWKSFQSIPSTSENEYDDFQEGVAPIRYCDI